MSEEDFSVVCSRIDEKKDFLEGVSRSIWEHPELGLKEVRAHATLTSALQRCGFEVQESYHLPTAFRAEYASTTSEAGPTIAVLLEYDALPEIGHACGHNLIAEAGIAAAIGVRAAMLEDPSLRGKLVVLGTPAEENAGGKILLMKAGAFEGMDAAMMVHPIGIINVCPELLSRVKMVADFKGRQAHAAGGPWKGRNALDAAVAAYNNIALLRQQLRPECRIHAILTKGGIVTNVIPADARLEVSVRAMCRRELNHLLERTKECFDGGARAAGCEVVVEVDEGGFYENLVTNKVMKEIYKGYAVRLGLRDTESLVHVPVGSTDMGNVSHCLPSIHPFFDLPTTAGNHSKAFTAETVAPAAQKPTLAAGKAMAMTVLSLMRRPEAMLQAKMIFQKDMEEGL